MWKRAFVALLSLNLLLIVAGTLWWGTLPKPSTIPAPSTTASGQAAPIDLAIGQDAINTYLQYALTEQADVKRVLAYGRVKFDARWDLQIGIKLADRVIPCDVELVPSIHAGNLWLQVQSANIGDLPVPPSALFLIFRHLPWPNWIGVNAPGRILEVNFTSRPQHPYGIRVLDYSAATRKLSLEVSIVPQSLLKSHP